MTMHAPPVLFGESDKQKVERLIAAAGAAIAALAMQYRAGEISRTVFIERAQAELHQRAQTAGGLAGSTSDGGAAIAAMIDKQGQYLDGYADDIESGKASDKQIAARAALWAGLLHTAYQMGKGAAVEADHTAQQSSRGKGERTTVAITWLCADDASSCGECPDLAAGSPYTFKTLPTVPGLVACGGNCRCDLDYQTVPSAEVDFARGPAFVLAGGAR